MSIARMQRILHRLLNNLLNLPENLRSFCPTLGVYEAPNVAVVLYYAQGHCQRAKVFVANREVNRARIGERRSGIYWFQSG